MENDLAIPGDLSPIALRLCDMIIATAGISEGSFPWMQIPRSLGVYAGQHFPGNDEHFGQRLPVAGFQNHAADPWIERQCSHEQ